jgi:hypothetical protein
LIDPSPPRPQRQGRAAAVEPLLLLLQGGLGNQLFQVVLARALAERQGRSLLVDPVLLGSRLRRLRGVTPRRPSPLLTRLVPELASPPWHRQLGARLAARWPGSGRDAVLTDSDLARFADAGGVLERLGAIRVLRTHATHPVLYTPPFEAGWRAVAAALAPLAGSSAPPALALHARRADYLHPRSGFFPLDASYYRRALARLLEAPAALAGAGRPTVHVFSDDPAWCRAQLADVRWELQIEAGSPEGDLARLASARALILSNSSFSAAAAHLARLRDPTTPVLCPDRWLLVEDGRLGDLRGPGWLALEA